MIEKTNAGIEQANRIIEKTKLAITNPRICSGTVLCTAEINVVRDSTKSVMAHPRMIEQATMLSIARTRLAFLGGCSFCC
jgi:hypothetical protein